MRKAAAAVRLALTAAFIVVLLAAAHGAPATGTDSADYDRTQASEDGESESNRLAFQAAVAPPSTAFTTWAEGDLIQVEIPAHWRELLTPSAVTFAPDGAYGNVGSSRVFTHGIAIGLAQDVRHNLRLATSDFVNARFFGGSDGGRRFTYVSVRIAARPGIHTTFTCMSPVTGGMQRVDVFTTPMGNSTVLFVLAITPAEARAAYAATFLRIVQSITMLDSSGPVRTPPTAAARH